MRSWFEFGYDGFPKGAQRRRFYQQRDDPCDSEEERDNDDESGDRPVLHLPLPKYKSPSVSPSASSYWSDEDRDGERLGLSTPTALMSTTVNDATAARYGASAVVAVVGRTAGTSTRNPRRRFIIEHGGVCVASQKVLNDFAVAEVTAPGTAETTLACSVPAIFDAQLSHRFCWDALHPALVADAATREAGEVPAQPLHRHGHCAIALPGYASSTRAVMHLSRPSDLMGQRATGPAVTASPNTAEADEEEAPVRSPLTSATAPTPCSAATLFQPKANEVVSLSLIVGGASSVLMHSYSGGPPTSVLGSPRNTAPPARATGSGPILNDPQLVLTLVAVSERPGVASHYTTRCFALEGSSSLYLAARVFASLSPWPTAVPDSAVRCTARQAASHTPLLALSAPPLPCVHRFAYLGGSLNGRQPMPLFGVTQLELNTSTWSVHHTTLETYGTEPAARYAHSATTWAHQLYVFGGVGRDRAVLNDLFTLDAHTLVWREVFIPSHYDVPRRAFHRAVVVPSWRRQQRRALEADAGERRWTRWLSQEGALQPDTDGRASEVEARQDDATPHTAGGQFSLLLMGGESCGGTAEAAVWGVDLGSHEWRQWSLRALRCNDGNPTITETAAVETWSSSTCSPPFPPRPTPALARIRRVLRSLADKEAERHGQRAALSRRAGPITTSATPAASSSVDNLSTYYVAAFFGALGTAVVLAEGEDDDAVDGDTTTTAVDRSRSHPYSPSTTVSIVFWGGTRSPPVQLVSQLDLPDEDVRTQCCLWLTSPDVASSSVMASFAPLLRRLLTPLLLADLPMRGPQGGTTAWSDRVFQSSPERAGPGDAPTADAETPLSLTQQSVEIGNQAAVESQLADWHRAALRRRRDQ